MTEPDADGHQPRCAKLARFPVPGAKLLISSLEDLYNPLFINTFFKKPDLARIKNVMSGTVFAFSIANEDEANG